MGLAHSPKIVTTNLVLYIDIGNYKSYSGSGNLIINLVSPEVKGNLANKLSSVTYDSNARGVMAFDGTNDYIDFGAVDLGVEAASKTMCAWIYVTAYPDNGLAPIVDRETGSSGYGFWMSTSGKLWYWPGSNIDVIDDGPLSVSQNTWTHVAISYNTATNETKFYYNGQSNPTKTALNDDIAPTTNSRLVIGALRNKNEFSFGNARYQGYIGPVSLYNRVLTDKEVQQNFNALRGRFGI